jgi:hypothetical protein
MKDLPGGIPHCGTRTQRGGQQEYERLMARMLAIRSRSNGVTRRRVHSGVSLAGEDGKTTTLGR